MWRWRSMLALLLGSVVNSIACRETVAIAYCHPENLLGECSYPVNWYQHGVAVSPRVFSASSACGQCLKIFNVESRKVILAHIIGTCHECNGGEISLGPTTFKYLGAEGQLEMRVDWETAFCSDIKAPFSYHFKAGSTRRHAYLQILNNALPIEALNYASRLGMDHDAFLTTDNYFELFDIGYRVNITLHASLLEQKTREMSSVIYFRTNPGYFLSHSQFLPI
ncbi:hypothetical protein DSO57_1004087 [Entomophthora muscae]|uniref:Uncharacterized protein n=1 Tax=Entomophthora muscae TaxID=34485 RepID=A0ACC2SXG8_9FUNG|nr:hypothetical protein DSO57_1004087 [Entomophthora muscae]